MKSCCEQRVIFKYFRISWRGSREQIGKIIKIEVVFNHKFLLSKQENQSIALRLFIYVCYSTGFTR